MSAPEKEMSFLDHLEELRSHIIRSVIAIMVCAVVIFVFKDFVFDTIVFGPAHVDFISFRAWCRLSEYLSLGDKLCISEIPYHMQNTTMSGSFMAHILISAIGGLIVAFPFVFWQIWIFIKPGLRQTEARMARGIVFFTSLLFFIGVLFGYFVIVPLSLQFLGGYDVGGVPNIITISSYMKLVASICLASGVMFLLPMVVYALSKLGIITPAILKQYRKHAVVAVLVLAAIITPPDVASQILVALPVFLLYEISILISARVTKQVKQD
ncbi:MAG: twin-arginine translocase subunit TatC [Flavobacteriales bacterium]|nr:twin-arginine translocase subunit TatC [Flavobacteriales bacterium]